jgi:CRP-like cAMP-binding protein
MDKVADTQGNRIADHPFLHGINSSFLHILGETAKFKRYEPGDTIIKEGSDADQLYLIHKGSVALEAYLPGKGLTKVQLLGAGESLGCSWLFPPYRWRFTARSLDATDATMFDARFLRDCMKANHEFGHEISMRIGQVLWQRLQSTRALLVDIHGVTE